MKYYRVVVSMGLLLFCGSLPGTQVSPQKATTSVPEVPIQSLRSFSPPKEAIWVKGKILTQTSDDTFIIQDASGQIILFLPTDELLNLTLTPGMEVLVLGKIDISNVSSSKNELYAERILLPND